MDDYNGPDVIDRLALAVQQRESILTDIATALNLDNVDDVSRVVGEMGQMIMSGNMSVYDGIILNRVVDAMQRAEALQSPWVFGQRYMRHRFVSKDPKCPKCMHDVPHRTIIVCPVCGGLGPWVMEERQLDSSYIHYLLVEQARRIVNSEMVLPGGEFRADGSATAVPRGGAKSTWLCEIMSLWLLLTGRSRCLLIVSNTTKQVSERANEIKSELTDNDLIIQDFGVQEARRNEARKWTEDDFTLPNMSRLVARGAMQSMRGVKNRQYRPDCVIADDADDDKFMSGEQPKKLHEWWDGRVVPACAPNSIFMFHGTVLGERALLSRALNESMGRTFSRRTIKALNDKPGCSVCGLPQPRVGAFDCPVCGQARNAVQPSSYWGARFPVQALESIKARVGHWSWLSEFQQQSHDDSTSWFEKAWLDRAKVKGLVPPSVRSRMLIPWSLIECSLTGDEMIEMARAANPAWAPVPGSPGPYQVILQSWDPAWARAKPKDQQSCWMAGISMGLTYDDKLDIMHITRDRGLAGSSAYRRWMHDAWKNNGTPAAGPFAKHQSAMVIESNGGGVLFQFDVEEHWGSVPMTPHTTGTEQYDLQDGIPGLASWFEAGRVIIRTDSSEEMAALADELCKELRFSGQSQYTDMLMALWIGWSYINRWIRDVRDPARYKELVRRSLRGQRKQTQRRA